MSIDLNANSNPRIYASVIAISHFPTGFNDSSSLDLWIIRARIFRISPFVISFVILFSPHLLYRWNSTYLPIYPYLYICYGNMLLYRRDGPQKRHYDIATIGLICTHSAKPSKIISNRRVYIPPKNRFSIGNRAFSNPENPGKISKFPYQSQRAYKPDPAIPL